MNKIIYFVLVLLLLFNSACKPDTDKSVSEKQVKPATKEEIAKNAYNIYHKYSKKCFNVDGLDSYFVYTPHGLAFIEDLTTTLDTRVQKTQQALAEIETDKDILRENYD